VPDLHIDAHLFETSAGLDARFMPLSAVCMVKDGTTDCKACLGLASEISLLTGALWSGASLVHVAT